MCGYLRCFGVIIMRVTMLSTTGPFELTPEEDGVPSGYPFRDWDWLRVGRATLEGSALAQVLLQQNLDS